MAYRNGTYVAFHAEGTSDPTESDMKYYRLLQAWHEHEDIEFHMINSHDKTSAVRDTSKRETLQARLAERLRNSRNMVLVVGERTRFDNDWIPYEISYAVDTCEIPIIVAYPGYDYVIGIASLRQLWPAALTKRIDSDSARTIHVPFRRDPLHKAIKEFDQDNMPKWTVTVWLEQSYRDWGLLK